MEVVMIANGSLYTNVMEKLRFDPSIDESDITVGVKGDNIVVLGGKVKTYLEKRFAEEAVEKIDKVKGVANELEVDLLSSSRRSDVDIVDSALNSLKWGVLVPHEKIKVAVDKGHLTLMGDVEYNYQKTRAQSAVEDLLGVSFVTNNIKIKPTIDPFEVKNKITKEFERNARIDASNIKVEVDGGKVTLKGKVKNFDEEREARDAAWSVPGVTIVIDQMSISW
jgi:osmotically-inducible protein OsmY